MNLKTLISLKFITYIATITALYFTFLPVLNYHSDLKRENEKLKELNEWNTKLQSPIFTLEGKKVVLTTIELIESHLKPIEKASNTNIRFFIGIIIIVIQSSVLSYIDKKIEKVKVKTNDKGEML